MFEQISLTRRWTRRKKRRALLGLLACSLIFNLAQFSRELAQRHAARVSRETIASMKRVIHAMADLCWEVAAPLKSGICAQQTADVVQAIGKEKK